MMMMMRMMMKMIIWILRMLMVMLMMMMNMMMMRIMMMVMMMVVLLMMMVVRMMMMVMIMIRCRLVQMMMMMMGMMMKMMMRMMMMMLMMMLVLIMNLIMMRLMMMVMMMVMVVMMMIIGSIWHLVAYSAHHMAEVLTHPVALHSVAMARKKTRSLEKASVTSTLAVAGPCSLLAKALHSTSGNCSLGHPHGMCICMLVACLSVQLILYYQSCSNSCVRPWGARGHGGHQVYGS